MNFQDLFVGALTLKSQTFEALRERSDVFQRGFVVLLFAGLIAGFFGAIPSAISDITPLMTEQQVIDQARSSFENSYNGPAELKQQIEPYVTEIASMVYQIRHLPPQAGDTARPVAALLDLVGNTLANPFSGKWIGWILAVGLLFQFSARLLGGRASMAQMLGLTCLAAAPQIFLSLTALLGLIATAAGTPALDFLTNALGFVISLWSAVIYVKATAVAQKFTIWRSIGAILLGYGLLIMMFIIMVILFGILLGVVIVPLANR